MISTNILCIHGAGEGAFAADKLLFDRLKAELGPGFQLHYPPMLDEASAPYHKWKPQIESEINVLDSPIILVGHSIGASHLAKVLTDTEATTPIAGVFLLAAPFWGGDGWRYPGFEQLVISRHSASKLSESTKIFIYHARDDEVVPFEHVLLYAHLFQKVTVREIASGGHQFDSDISVVAEDIRSIIRQ